MSTVSFLGRIEKPECLCLYHVCLQPLREESLLSEAYFFLREGAVHVATCGSCDSLKLVREGPSVFTADLVGILSDAFGGLTPAVVEGQALFFDAALQDVHHVIQALAARYLEVIRIVQRGLAYGGEALFAAQPFFVRDTGLGELNQTVVVKGGALVRGGVEHERRDERDGERGDEGAGKRRHGEGAGKSDGCVS